MYNKKKNKKLVIVMAIMIILQSIYPIISTYASEGDDLDKDFVIKSINVKINDKEEIVLNDEDDTEEVKIEVNENTTIRFTLSWEIDDNVKLKEKDWAKVKLPDFLKNVNDGGELTDDNEVVGSYEFEGDYLKVIFNKELVERTENRNGEVGFLMKFELDNL